MLNLSFKEWLLRNEDFGNGPGPMGASTYWYGSPEQGMRKRRPKKVELRIGVDLSKQGIQSTSLDPGS